MAERAEASFLKRLIEEAQQSESKRMKIIMASDEPEVSSPLGLKLTKSPSFLELIDTKLSRPTTVSIDNIGEYKVQYASERLKAVNFPALSLQIGSWKRVASHESDIVGKCYFCKEKFVWEILSNGLKSKMEIPWHSISAIRATFAEKQPDTLEIELKMPPTFWLETNQQPRKHTIWKISDDFTDGYARAYKRHFLMFKEGTLERHYMNILQVDARLYELSRKPFPTDEFPLFDDSPDHKGMLMLQPYQKCIHSMNLIHSFGSQTAMLQTMSMNSPSLPHEDITEQQTPTVTNMLNPAMNFQPMDSDVSFPLAIDPMLSHIGNYNCQIDSINAPMEIPPWNNAALPLGMNPFYADDQSLLQTTSSLGGQVGVFEDFRLRNDEYTLGDPNLLMPPGVYNQVEEDLQLPENSTWMNGGNFRF